MVLPSVDAHRLPFKVQIRPLEGHGQNREMWHTTLPKLGVIPELQHPVRWSYRKGHSIFICVSELSYATRKSCSCTYLQSCLRIGHTVAKDADGLADFDIFGIYGSVSDAASLSCLYI